MVILPPEYPSTLISFIIVVINIIIQKCGQWSAIQPPPVHISGSLILYYKYTVSLFFPTNLLSSQGLFIKKPERYTN